MILILKTGSAPENIKANRGDFEDWIAEKMELSKSEYAVHFTGNYDELPEELNYSGIIITGSPLMVTDLKINTSNISHWLLDKQESGIPILGICFGHQLLNVINGGSVQNIKSRIIIGSKKTYLTHDGKQDALFENLPASFDVFKTHSQCISTFPESAKVLSTNNFGIIDAIKFSAKTWGVQFHPEFNSDIMRLYIEEKKDRLISDGYDVDELSKTTVNIDWGEKIFKRFKEIIYNA